MISIDRLNKSFSYRIRAFYTKSAGLFWKNIIRIIISNKRDITEKKILFVFVVVWGDEHIDLFFKYGLPSLMQSKNLPSIKNKKIIFHFYTKQSDVITIKNKMTDNFYDFYVHSEKEFHNYERGILLNSLIHILELCVKERAIMLISPPDSFFSNGSVHNLVAISEGKGVSVAVPHARVSSSCIRNYLTSDSFVNNEIDGHLLVKLAFQCGHASLLFSDELLDSNATEDGMSIRRLNDNSVSVVHNLPTVYLINPIKEDVSFFKRRTSFNDVDHLWPYMLLRQSRLKVVGSSNIAFAVELTDDNDKIPKLKKSNRFNDQCGDNNFCCGYMSMVVSSWDSE